MRAVCVLQGTEVTGVVEFEEIQRKVVVTGTIRGLSDGLHGFHVHEYGDLRMGCTSTCKHFNPFNKQHGGPESAERHVGDLGNVYSRNGVARVALEDSVIALRGKRSIVGRALVVHADPDDLGLGDNKKSLETGNSGKRLACGVIGLAAPKNSECVKKLLGETHAR